jgi:hypothetical protein
MRSVTESQPRPRATSSPTTASRREVGRFARGVPIKARLSGLLAMMVVVLLAVVWLGGLLVALSGLGSAKSDAISTSADFVAY